MSFDLPPRHRPPVPVPHTMEALKEELSPSLSASYVAWENVTAHGAVGDDVTNSKAGIDAAIKTVSDAGGGIVYIPPGKYIADTLTPRSNVTIYGPGATIRSTAKANVFTARDTAFKNFTLDSLIFTGPVNVYPTVPTRVSKDDVDPGHNMFGPGTMSAFTASGDTDTDSPGGARMENITIRNCAFRNLVGLPLLLKGVRGVLRIINNEFTRTMDVGFVCYEELIFSGNHVYGSRDNGVSASRGGKKITITNNAIENCAYNGIFVAGFLADKGPQNFTVAGNTIKDVGNSGIYLDSAPKYGAVTGNTLDGGYYRGPVDNPTDGAVSGVFIGGYPLDNRAAPTDWAQDISVVGNTIRRFPRAGVYGTGLKRVHIANNLICDIGTQYLADGTTSIATAEPTTNVGILIDNTAVSGGIVVTGNQIEDGRTTPYCNWGIQPNVTGAVTALNNTMAGCRNPYNISETGPQRNIQYTAVFMQNSKHTLGATAGSNAGTGTIAGFDINGAVGSTRRHKIQSGGSDRWQYGGSGDAEAGANVGTNFRINAYTDAGVFSKTMLDLTRDGKLGFNGATPVVPATLPAAATDLATAITLLNAMRTNAINLGLAK